MKLRIIPFLALLLTLTLPQAMQAQFDFMQQGTAGGATFSHEFEPAEARVGQVVTLVMEAQIDPGYHLYAAEQIPAAEANAATFSLDPEANDLELIGGLQDGIEPKVKFDEIFGYDLGEFYDRAVFTQKVKITGPNPNLVGFLRYQVCNASQCIPKTYEIEERLAVQTVEAVTEPQTEPASEPEPNEAPAPVIVEEVKEKDGPEEKAEPMPTEAARATQAPGIIDAVDWEVSFEPTQPKKGDLLRVTFTAKIKEGYHVYSSIPPAKPAGLPTTFNFNGRSQDLAMQGDLSETGEAIQKYDEIFETDVVLFHDAVTFTQELEVTGGAPILEGYLSYQVCDDRACVTEKVEVLETFGHELAAEPTLSEATPVEGEKEEGLGLLLLQGFLLGLASIFTPCIFPMIPLTVSIFTKQGNERGKGIRKAIFYGLSIVGIFTGLAVLISVIFGPWAIQQLSNHPAFNLVFFVLLFVFALSFLGMFEIALPSSWSTAMSKRSDRGGLVGIFFMAMALAIVSFSCTGPLVATALAQAFQGSFFTPVLVMLAFSTALALPFVLLAAFPALLQSMPRSGGWLNAVKVSLGLLELALAFIYLSRADLVMHWGILDREIFIGAWIVIFTMLGLYLLGKIRLPHDDPAVEKLSVPRFLLAMATFWFVLYLVPGLWGAPLKMLGGFIPSSTQDMGVLIQRDQLSGLGSGPAVGNGVCTFPDKVSGHLSEETPAGFCAFYDLEQGLAYAKQVNKPVFLDFTGHTCANCRYLEKNAWVDPELRRYINEEYVLISLYTDDRQALPEIEVDQRGQKLRTVGDKWLSYQVEEYGSNAQPFYVLLDPEGNELLPPMGYNPPLDIESYRDFFARGLQAFEGR